MVIKSLTLPREFSVVQLNFQRKFMGWDVWKRKKKKHIKLISYFLDFTHSFSLWGIQGTFLTDKFNMRKDKSVSFMALGKLCYPFKCGPTVSYHGNKTSVWERKTVG